MEQPDADLQLCRRLFQELTQLTDRAPPKSFVESSCFCVLSLVPAWVIMAASWWQAGLQRQHI